MAHSKRGRPARARRAVRAAEKRDELWKAGEARPRCRCHDEPMTWSAEARLSGGGRWRCAVSQREKRARHRAARPELNRATVERWRRGETGYAGADERPTRVVGYAQAHARLVHERGKALCVRACVDCGGPASEWSYDGGAPDERADTAGPYADRPFSLDPSRYSPRCTPCHRRYDA